MALPAEKIKKLGEMEKYQQLELFKARLPKKPYCTDELTYGLAIKTAQQAIKRRYIQPNYPWLLTWLVFDVDRDGAAYDWQWLDSCPTPNIIAENRDNGHAHLFYGLEIPVAVNNFSKTKSAKYAAAIQYALMKKLGADPGYNGFTAKNPLHKYWHVIIRQEFAYTLDWLADYLDLETIDARRRAPDYGIGRNVTLFNILRLYAYRAVKTYWHDRKQGYSAFYDDLQIKAYQTNITEFPNNRLYRQEIDHIIKSVRNWTWKHFTPELFAERQKQRGLRSAAKRRTEADKKRQILFEFMTENPNATNRELADKTGLNIRMVQYHKKAIKSGKEGTIS